jgi:hypothetical protein
MLQAANTGHRGLLTTLHAGGPEEVPARLEAMALAAPGAGLDVVRRPHASVDQLPSFDDPLDAHRQYRGVLAQPVERLQALRRLLRPGKPRCVRQN